MSAEDGWIGEATARLDFGDSNALIIGVAGLCRPWLKENGSQGEEIDEFVIEENPDGVRGD